MKHFIPVLVGKLARAVTRLRGGGSAFPGYLVLKLSPGFIQDVANSFRHGIVFVLGSNGKSTTTHMLAETLRGHGLNVFTNPSGSNLPQGIASAIVADSDLFGRVKGDIGVLEVDEGYAVELAKVLAPTTVLALNTQVDQLYRFYETERVADMMLDAAALASEHIVSNREDPYLSKIWMRYPDGDATTKPDISYFGATDDIIAASPSGLVGAPDYRHEGIDEPDHHALAEVTATAGNAATIEVRGEPVTLELPAKGLHFALDAAAALATAAVILGDDFDGAASAAAFAAMKPAYGRGELLKFGDEQVEFVMFKNGASLQLNLDAITEPPEQVLLSIDEGTPDISWIYDVSFAALDHVDVITGDKAWQIATRLEHEGFPIGTVEPDLNKAIDLMRAMPAPAQGHKTWIVNYEQMMLARKRIGYLDMENQR
ncbi:MAG TPA: MurT ligase domain-containing protein [Terrimesophilobacter sp.]|nr:MurT ligase domain-containing protein [Terrimesophilobacter sp.]HRP99069.1 MurT ligase domain-containing protein [Terrimesophilobacter sp.]